MVLYVLIVVLCVAVLLTTVAFMFSYEEAPQGFGETEKRQKLLHMVKNLRLSDMLVLLKIPLWKYIQTVPLDEIKKHVSTCRGCTELDVCDDCLKKGVPEKDMRFCPNHQSLLSHARSLREALKNKKSY